jgi:protein Tex
MTNYAESITIQLKLKSGQAAAAIELFDAGNTIPFIARYRKEATNTLDEDQLRNIENLLAKLRALDERRATILASIEEQGKMTPELMEQITKADSLVILEDLYAPYKPKRRTRASIAREKGLQELADMILQQSRTRETAEERAKAFLNENVETVEDALAGARDIVAETISDHAEVRRVTREKALKLGVLNCTKIEDAKDEKSVYALYYENQLRVDRLQPHQVLAINRGENEKVLRVGLEVADREWQAAAIEVFEPDARSPFMEQLEMAIVDAGERLLMPSIERDVRRTLTEKAEAHAISVFAANMRSLLGQPPLLGYTVLGIDPGFRTGSKVAVVDPTGKLLDTATIYPHEPHKKTKESMEKLNGLIEKHHVNLISIGNGTASRETEQFTAALIRDREDIRYLIVSEAGASIYSASPLARAEFPDLDVSIRGAVSIARRAQDPLAELVKIDPKSIGVGMYQHDVDQAALTEALTGVVESVVNRVGVDVNTASFALLAYVSGIGGKLAERIVAHRDENGVFVNRRQLRDVSGLGPKAFEQSAGFLRIRSGENPLDASAIHPESYPVAEAALKRVGLKVDSLLEERKTAIDALMAKTSVTKLAEELSVGAPTLTDILEQLVRPGRDPRQDLPAPILRSDVLSMEDLLVGMQLKGTVRNVIDFGAFVDIGVKQDGLLHKSQIPYNTLLQVGDVIDVEIMKVEAERGRIGLGWPKKT